MGTLGPGRGINKARCWGWNAAGLYPRCHGCSAVNTALPKGPGGPGTRQNLTAARNGRSDLKNKGERSNVTT